MMRNRGNKNKKVQQNAGNTMQSCAKDITQYIIRNGCVKMDELDEELDYGRPVIETTVAKLLMKKVIKANTNVEFLVTDKFGTRKAS